MLLLSVNPILLHSLSLLLHMLPLPAILNASIPSVALHSCPSAVLYYRTVITWAVITGIYLFTIYMTHVMTKVGSARRSTRKWIFVAERQGRLRPPRREVGLALVGVRRYITRLTSSWYLI